MVKNIKKWFLTSIFGLWYFSIILWLDKQKFKRELRNRPNNFAHKIAYNATKAAYNEGINKVKGEIAKLIKSRSKEEYESALTNINELLSLAQNEHRAEIEALKTVYLYKGKDVNSDLDQARMVSERIQHYRELHKHVELRNKVRQERKNNGK